MAKNLFIVESPAKAKTIEGFLGKEFVVKSSIGHIRDLVKAGMGVDIENNFEPTYEISPDKKAVVSELKKLAKQADIIWLATDEDREGEAISWHLAEALDIPEKKRKRVVYHEITKKAITDAIANPRVIDQNLVDAQQARRILDRLVGFELSPILWKKIRPSLSAGRVQSVSVRLIVEREREIINFTSVSSYKVAAIFTTSNGATVKAELPKRFATLEEAKTFLEKCRTATFSISNLETKPAKKSPSAPFTTSTLQQEASRKFGYSVAQTMSIAQKLYEQGKITYMRTDSVNLSEQSIENAKNEITRLYGEKFSNPRKYKTKSKGAQEAHEAIRPTYLNQQTIDGDTREIRLYDLIWKRTLASQMADAELEKTTVTIKISTATENFVAQGEVLKFEGFLKVYIESTDDENDETTESLLPVLKVGEVLNASEINAIERFSHHPPRYTEASLVKKLEELGIGRPSTYAPTISTVQKRGYVVKEDKEGTPRNYNALSIKAGELKQEVRTENTGAEKSKLFPTDIGMVVTDFLMLHFKDILDFNFTAKVEEEFDEVAEGKLSWRKMLQEFYKPFHKTVTKTSETSERASGERLLGVDPKTGKNVYVRIGRFGPMVQLGEGNNEEEKPKYASLRKDQRLETITFEQALDLFKLPRTLGTYEGEEITVAIGRFGPYLKHNNVFYSLPRTDDPYAIEYDRAVEILKMPKLPRVIGMHKNIEISAAKGRFGPYLKYDNLFCTLPKTEDPFLVTLEKAVQLIEDKIKKENEKLIKAFPEDSSIKVVNGRYGPCIQVGKKFFKIPKEHEPSDLTYQQCLDLAGIKSGEAGKEDKKGKGAKAAKAAKPAKKKASTKKATKPKAAKKTTKK
ncbi:MAG: type I DNA topoisomerase [Bacteroidetes bacterium]|nr:type I DNA topoisomerase [Bacteroidota bacterium]